MEMEKVDDDDGGYTPPAVPASPTSTPSNSLESTKSPPPPPPTPIEEVRTPSEPQPALMTDEKDMAVDNIDNKVLDTEDAVLSASDTNLEEASGGLFAGLSLSSPNSNNESTTAPNPSQTATTTTSDKTTANDKTQTTNEKQPTSRASTPVHSNASPGGGDIDNMKKKKATSSPLVVRSNSINSSTAPAIPPLSTNKQSPSTNNNPNSTNKPQKLTIAIPPTTKISHPDTTLRLLRKFYTKSSANIPISAGGKQVSSWYGWVFGSGAEIGGEMVSLIVFYCLFSWCSVFVDYALPLKAQDFKLTQLFQYILLLG